MDLDYVVTTDDGKKLPTLRQMIMSIKSRKHEGYTLFHSIGKSWRNSNEFLLQSIPRVAEEASLMAENLITFLKHEHGHFHSWAVQVCIDDKYDPETGNVTTITDAIVAPLINGDEELNFIVDKTPAQATRPDPSNIVTTLIPHYFPSDETVSTLGTLGTKGGRDGANLSFAPVQSIQPRNMHVPTDSQSVVSAVTIHSIQQSIAHLNSMLGTIMAQLPESDTPNGVPTTIDMTHDRATSDETGGGQG